MTDGAASRSEALREIARLFLRLGTTAFGGPAAHVAMMEEEVVRRRGWVSRQEFLDLLGAANLIPGPNSTELAIHLGHRRAGWPGLLVAGSCFIAPAALLTGALAAAYVRWGALPPVQGLLYGAKPVVLAVVAQALVGLARTALRDRLSVVSGAVAVLASAAGLHELAVLLGCGLATASLRVGPRPGARGDARAAALALPAALPTGAGATGAAAAAATPFGLGPLFLCFVKVGAVLFGSGYVLLAFLRADLVDRFHWLTEAQLLDAVAAGQLTPGPVFTTATFVGYLLGGSAGAAVATLGIFLPAFVFVAASGPLVPRIRRSAWAGAFLDGVNVASLALMAVVTALLARTAVVDLPTLVLATGSAYALLRHRLGSVRLVLGGALTGLAVHVLR